MDRKEALRLLGLTEDVSIAEIKVAYKETAQILHPDRFVSNKKLQERATEQFKILQEAYTLLIQKKENPPRSRGDEPATVSFNTFKARYAGLTAACSQLVAERDMLLDQRRNGLLLSVIGLVVTILLRRVPAALALGGAAVVWGLTKVIFSQNSINVLSKNISEIKIEKKKLEEQMEKE